uniref:Nucleotid_trans domain-containing protein n=1 Tax=Ascaris lumbricoides TaxID=6252 RepID=A0A0M3I568_ASCLU
MSNCEPLFGKVTVFVAVVTLSYATHYRVAQKTLQCYLRSVNYKFLLVDLDTDKRVNKECKHDQLFFKKHCAASVYLEDTDWMLVLDADTGVVNPNHCIEEWIDERVDVIFYERFFNWEIASGNYLVSSTTLMSTELAYHRSAQVRNTPFAKSFLRRWADWQFIQPPNWNGADNGVLQMHILQTVLSNAKQEIKNCDTIWRMGRDYETYMAFVTCVKIYLGATRIWPGKIRILRRAHGWVRDGFLTTDRWSDRDFMLHGWKQQEIGIQGWKSPFFEMIDENECGQNLNGWHWRNESHVSDEEIKRVLSEAENGLARNFPKEAIVIPYLSQPDIAECFPNCDDTT